jgi:tetratricopeptide (TPR) repeat protein
MSGSRRWIVLLVLVAIAAVILWWRLPSGRGTAGSAVGGGDGWTEPAGVRDGSAGTRSPQELQRHLQQARELLRLYQVGRALAELDQCLQLDPDHVEAQFHRFRARLYQQGEESLETLRAESGVIPPPWIHSLDLQFQTVSASGSAALQGLQKDYGEVSLVHGDILEQMQGDGLESLRGPWRIPARLREPRSQEGGELRDLIERTNSTLTRALQEDWQQLCAETPGLQGLRLFYAGALHWARRRFPEVDGPDAPPSYSGYTLDLAQSMYEAALDESALQSRAAWVALYGLGDVALRMGDYAGAEQSLKILLEQPGLPDAWRDQALFTLGVAAYKSQKLRKAVRALRPLFDRKRDIEIGWLLHLCQDEPFPFRGKPSFEGLTPLRFKEQATELGIAKVDGAGPSAWGDVDGDGDLDLFVCGCDTFSALYRNDGGRFTDISREAGLLQVPSGFSATLVDFDNDGALDLYIGRNGWSGAGDNSLFRGRGDGTFEDVTEPAGVGSPGSSFVHSWADFDRDGLLDLYVANGIADDSRNRLFRNRGAGRFEDITQAAGLEEDLEIKTIGFAIGDYDKDGWPDLFVGGHSTDNRLYRNQGDGTFQNVAAQAGVVVEGDAKLAYVSFFFDYDNDGWLDILATKQAQFTVTLFGQLRRYQPEPRFLGQTPRLFRNRGDGSFEDVSQAAGWIYPHGVMGANVADFNNDGHQDVYFGTGGPDIHWLEMNHLYVNRGDGRFEDVTRWTGTGHIGKGHGVTTVDLDHDGDLDLYSPQGGFDCGDLWANVFYRNEGAPSLNWLQVELCGITSNRMGVGAQLTLQAGSLLGYQEMRGGGGFGSCSSPVLHFGLGDHRQVDELTVRWPSGAETRLAQLPANQRIRITEGEPDPQVIQRARSGQRPVR